MVLKLIYCIYIIIIYRAVSVPLRGYGFEIPLYILLRIIFNNVSVPLRGYGFEIMNKKMEGKLKYGFRPLTGIWF